MLLGFSWDSDGILMGYLINSLLLMMLGIFENWVCLRNGNLKEEYDDAPLVLIFRQTHTKNDATWIFHDISRSLKYDERWWELDLQSVLALLRATDGSLQIRLVREIPEVKKPKKAWGKAWQVQLGAPLLCKCGLFHPQNGTFTCSLGIEGDVCQSSSMIYTYGKWQSSMPNC